MMSHFLKPLVLVCLSTAFSVAQTLPVIQATGGEGQSVNWPQIQKEEDAEKDGPGFFYRDCSQGVKVVSASSTLKDQGGKTYGVNNLADDNPMTAWVEGKPGYGIGESFTIKAPRVNSIFNGYQATPATWKNNSRVKKFKVYADGKPICFLLLKDEMGEQVFELPLSSNNEKDITFKFEIADVYKGLKWDDVAISHVDNNGCCFAGKTTIGPDNIEIESIAGSDENVAIICINPLTNESYHASQYRVTAQLHTGMVEVSTAHHSITITTDHPLAVKGMGFVSLQRLRLKRGLDNIESLAGVTDVMVWDGEHACYEKITSIRKIPGAWKTYTIKGLPLQSAYVAGGFVTTSY